MNAQIKTFLNLIVIYLAFLFVIFGFCLLLTNFIITKSLFFGVIPLSFGFIYAASFLLYQNKEKGFVSNKIWLGLTQKWLISFIGLMFVLIKSKQMFLLPKFILLGFSLAVIASIFATITTLRKTKT